jgi:hypothetical protein
VNAEGAARGMRGGRVDLMGGDALAEVGVGKPLRPEVNCSSVLARYKRETYKTRIPITRNQIISR